MVNILRFDRPFRMYAWYPALSFKQKCSGTPSPKTSRLRVSLLTTFVSFLHSYTTLYVPIFKKITPPGVTPPVSGSASEQRRVLRNAPSRRNSMLLSGTGVWKRCSSQLFNLGNHNYHEHFIIIYHRQCIQLHQSI